MSYSSEALKTRSEKITLVTIDSVEQVKLFTSNGADWDRVTNYFVVGVKENGTPIATWTYTPSTKTLKIVGGADPKTRKISLTYRHFFSNAAVILPYDLATGADVEWEPRILSIGSIGQQLDNENTGIVLESSSNVALANRDGFFDSFFDTHIWENQAVKFYSWFPNIPISERRQLFEGVIETKNFSETQVTFNIKDFVFKLKNRLNLELFSESDGDILPSILETPKRRIYGQADYVKCVSLDATLNGFSAGQIQGDSGSSTITTASADFLDGFTPGDEIIVTINNAEYKLTIDSIESNTSLTISEPLEITIPPLTECRLRPKLSHKTRNRNWHIAGHKLRSITRTLATVISPNKFTLADTSELNNGDYVSVDGEFTTIRRISGDIVVLNTNISPTPSPGATFFKMPVSRAFLGTKELTYIRDYVEVNNTGGCKIELDPLAEFNIADQRTLNISFGFINGEREISTSDIVDLKTILRPNDYIRSSSTSRTTWYQILDVKEQTVILRTPLSFSGGPFTETAFYKNVDVIDENSLVTVHCLGMEKSSAWIKTPSDAVRDMILNDAGFPSINETSFSKAKTDCDYILSMVIPDSIGGDVPNIRDTITKINNSVFGSLYGDSTNSISFSILNSRKPESITALKDDDILSFSIETTQKIVNNVIVNYRPYVDVLSEEDVFLKYSFASSFVDDLIGIESVTERTLYLYETSRAEIMAQRIALYNSMTNSSAKIKAKMNLSEVVVNDKIYLNLDRLYSRYGGLDKRKLGSVTGTKKDGYGTEITITDLGNIYNRVPSIAPDSTLDYSTATNDDKIKWGYILDDDTLTPDPANEEGLGNFIIG